MGANLARGKMRSINPNNIRARHRNIEGKEQEKFYNWIEDISKYADALYPDIDLFHHIPNGGKRSQTEGARFKREGVKKGVVDNFLPVARKEYNGLYIEMKPTTEHSSSVSESQREFLARVSATGFAAIVCYGHIEAVQVVMWYYDDNDKRYIKELFNDELPRFFAVID